MDHTAHPRYKMFKEVSIQGKYFLFQVAKTQGPIGQNRSIDLASTVTLVVFVLLDACR